MRSPTMVGELWPRPGIGAFQAMFSVSLQCVGGFWPGVAMPSRVGPRQAGQSRVGSTFAAEVVAGRISAKMAATSAKIRSGFTGGVWRDGDLLSSEESQRDFKTFARIADTELTLRVSFQGLWLNVLAEVKSKGARAVAKIGSLSE